MASFQVVDSFPSHKVYCDLILVWRLNVTKGECACNLLSSLCTLQGLKPFTFCQFKSFIFVTNLKLYIFAISVSIFLTLVLAPGTLRDKTMKLNYHIMNAHSVEWNWMFRHFWFKQPIKKVSKLFKLANERKCL